MGFNHWTVKLFHEFSPAVRISHAVQSSAIGTQRSQPKQATQDCSDLNGFTQQMSKVRGHVSGRNCLQMAVFEEIGDLVGEILAHRSHLYWKGARNEFEEDLTSLLSDVASLAKVDSSFSKLEKSFDLPQGYFDMGLEYPNLIPTILEMTVRNSLETGSLIRRFEKMFLNFSPP